MNRVLLIAGWLSVAELWVGCAKDPEVVVRERAKAYTQLLEDERYDQAVDYYDPDLVASKGRTAIAGGFKFVVGVAKGLTQAAGRKLAGFEIRKVDFDSEKTHATLQVVYLTAKAGGADRQESPTDQKWVLKNGVWYATQ